MQFEKLPLQQGSDARTHEFDILPLQPGSSQFGGRTFRP
jgi:hypothetical protein